MHQHPKPIVVGIDGSNAAVQAAVWAATEATARDVPLQLIYVAATDARTASDADFNVEFDYGHDALEKARRAVALRDDSVKVETKVVSGELASTFVGLSENAEMIVLGSVGIGFFAAMILGSTAASLARNAACPTVIVRAAHRYAEVPCTGPVVVPLYESAKPNNLLKEAFREAKLRGADVLAVRVWQPRPWAVPAGETAAIPDSSQEDPFAALRSEFPSVTAQVVKISGYPVAYLEEISKSAQLVVVGRRGATSERSAHLDSIAHAVVYHASCPVLVVPENA